MAGAFVQQVANGVTPSASGTSLTFAAQHATTIGNTLVIVVEGRSQAVVDVGTPPIDSKGNEYTADAYGANASANSFVNILSGAQVSALAVGDTFTINFSEAIGPAVGWWVFEFSGLLTASSPLDQTGGYAGDGEGTGFASIPTLGPTVQADEVAVYCAVAIAPFTFTQAAGYSSPATFQQSTSGAVPGDRAGCVGYKILTSVSTPSETAAVGLSSPTNIAGAIATYRASGGGSGPGGSTQPYGNYFEADALANFEIGYPSDRRVSYRWRQVGNDTLTGFTLYQKSESGDAPGAGYSSGTGGSWRLRVETDDGTSNHFPTGTLAGAGATVTVTTANDDGGGKVCTLGTPLAVTDGTIYHMVLNNPDASPAVNYTSIDDLLLGKGTSPLNRIIPDIDQAVLKKDGAGAWAQQNFHYPIWARHYQSGAKKGQSYMDAFSGSGLHDIGTANNAVRMRFVPSFSLTVNRAWVRLYRQAGTTQPLTIQLRNAAGTILASGTVPASAVHVGSYADWVSITFAPVALISGQTYRLEFWATSETVPYRTFPIQAGPGSGGFATMDADNVFTDGYFEFTTNGGASWSQHIDTRSKVQAYLEQIPPDPPATVVIAHRTMMGIGS